MSCSLILRALPLTEAENRYALVGCEPGRRSGRRAKSSMEETVRRTVMSQGWRLFTNRNTPASQTLWNMYTVAITEPKAANTRMNNAKAASSSRTKYNWNAAMAPRKYHNHLRLTSFLLLLIA